MDRKDVRLIRSNRRTISLEITGTGEILVRAPRRMPEADIRAFVEAKKAWLTKHLQKREQEIASIQEEGRFTEQEIQRLKVLAKQIVPEKVAYYARLMGVTYGKITIRKQKTRWGSCTQEGNLNFNCLLMMAPPEVLDYVVIHELCHRIEMNHSVSFWALVEKMMPDYKVHRRWLKDQGTRLMMRIE